MQSIGNVNEDEMYRVFNMGIGMTFIVNPDDIGAVTDALKDLTDVYEVGFVVSGEKHVSIN